MKILHRRCAGLDMDSDSIAACVRTVAKNATCYHGRRFSTTARDLIELAGWLEVGAFKAPVLKGPLPAWRRYDIFVSGHSERSSLRL